MNALQECMFVSVLDDYRHGFIGSRDFVRQTELIVGGRDAAVNVLGSIGFSAADLWSRDQAPTFERPTPSSGVTVSPDDPTMTVRSVTYHGEACDLSGYVAQPADAARHPAVMVIHENRGLVEHIRDVARRFARAGYVALAPDLLSRVGGTANFASLDELQSSLRTIPPGGFVADLNSALDHLKSLPCVDSDRLGVTGFCFGGGLTWRLLTVRQDMKAGVPFYGAAPPSEDVPKIRAAVLAIYAELDDRINATIPELEKAIQASGVRYGKVMYPGVGHAFHNDTGLNYNAAAAADAWSRTLEHFGRYLQ